MSLVDTTVVAVVITTIGAVIGQLINRQDEHRITVNEENQKSLEGRIKILEDKKPQHQFSDEEKRILLDSCLKVSLLWSAYEKNLPLILKNPKDLDDLLDRASKLKIDEINETFTKTEKDKLIKYLKTRLNDSDRMMGLYASIYLDMLTKDLGDKKC